MADADSDSTNGHNAALLVMLWKAIQRVLWYKHPIMEAYRIEREAKEEFERICSKATPRVRELVASLPVELLEHIFHLCAEDWPDSNCLIPPRSYRERARLRKAGRETRQTLFACLLVCRQWTRIALRLVGLKLFPLVTSKAHCGRIVRSLRLSANQQFAGSLERLDIVFPSPFYAGSWDDITCGCEPALNIGDCVRDEFAPYLNGSEQYSASWSEFDHHGDRLADFHGDACASVMAKGALQPSLVQLVQLFTTCHSLTSLTLTNIQWCFLDFGGAAVQALRGLQSLRHFSCTFYSFHTDWVFWVLISSWPALEFLHLALLYREDYAHSPYTGVTFGLPVPARSLPERQHLRPPAVKAVSIGLPAVVEEHWDVFHDLLAWLAESMISLRIVGPADEVGRSSSMSIGGPHLEELRASLCRTLEHLTVDATPYPTWDGTWGHLTFFEWLVSCDTLLSLTVGPGPELSEALLAAIPAKVMVVNVVLEAAEKVPDPVEMADLLCNSPSLYSRTYAIKVQVPSAVWSPLAQVDARDGWTDEERRVFVDTVSAQCANLGSITALQEDGSMLAIWSAT